MNPNPFLRARRSLGLVWLCFWSLQLLVDAAASADAASAALRRRLSHKDKTPDVLDCRLLNLESLVASDSIRATTTADKDHSNRYDESQSSLACQTAHGVVYTVTAAAVVDERRLHGWSRSWITVPRAWLAATAADATGSEAVLQIPAGGLPPDFQVRAPHHRHHNNIRNLPEEEADTLELVGSGDAPIATPPDFTRLGRKTLLAVRVVTHTEAPDVTLAAMEAALFGTAPHPAGLTPSAALAEEEPYVSVVEQYARVSLGHLLWEPLTGPGYEQGVLEVNLADFLQAGEDYRIAGLGVQSLAPTLLQATAARLGVAELTNAADHVIFCLPNDSLLAGTTAWTAFTYLYEPYSYYQRSRCTKLSVVMHELGHSLGFRHSGVPTNAYADETGYMGYSVNQYGAPVKGFNAHKNWLTQWMQHYAQHLQVTDPSVAAPTTYRGRLASIVDAPQAVWGKEVVLLKLGNSLYVQYNRAKGFHRESGTPDQVSIVYATSDEDASTRVATLKVGEVYAYGGYPRLDEGADEQAPDDNVGLVVALCALGVDDAGDDDPIDYAELVIQWRGPDQLREAPSAAVLSQRLCALRSDRSAPLLTFGMEVDDGEPARDDGAFTPPILPDGTVAPPQAATGTRQQTVLLVMGIAMATIGLACLCFAAVLVMRQCRQMHESAALPPRDGLRKSDSMPSKSDSAPTTPDTQNSFSSADSWEATDHEVTDSSRVSRHDDEDEPVVIVEIPTAAVPSTPPRSSPRRDWWEDIVESFKKLVKDEDRVPV
jgi:hypothetical protein